MRVDWPSPANPRGFDVLLGTPRGPYKTSNLKFLAKLGICKCIHVLASRNIAFSWNIAAGCALAQNRAPTSSGLMASSDLWEPVFYRGGMTLRSLTSSAGMRIRMPLLKVCVSGGRPLADKTASFPSSEPVYHCTMASKLSLSLLTV